MNKTVLITGAAKGIGRATALLFAEKGYTVIINYNNSDKLAEELVQKIKSIGADVLAVKADISDRDAVQNMMLTIKKNLFSVDILVNNAGIDLAKSFLDTSYQDWRKVFSINVDGMYHVTSAVLPDMIKRKQGKIVNVSSVLGVSGSSCEVAYSASKGAVVTFTKALAKEVGPNGVNVNCVAPGVIATDMSKNLTEETLENLKENTSLRRIGTAKDIANCIYFLCSEEANFITGEVISPTGGLII